MDLTRFFNEMREEREMLFFHAEEFVEQGDRVVMLGRCGWRCRATGKAVESPTAHFWRFQGDKAIDDFEFYDTAAALAAARPEVANTGPIGGEGPC